MYHLQDYGWIKDGMIFPFAEYMDRSGSIFLGKKSCKHLRCIWIRINNFVYALFRFRTQTQLYGSKPSQFRASIEEALLVENGNAGSDHDAGHEDNPVINHNTIGEAIGSNRDMDYFSYNKVSVA